MLLPPSVQEELELLIYIKWKYHYKLWEKQIHLASIFQYNSKTTKFPLMTN